MVLRHRDGWDPAFLSRSPWFWPLRSAGAALTRLQDWPTRAALDSVFARRAQLCGAPALRFGQALRKRDKHDGAHVRLEGNYDVRITQHGEVPTRERNWHDLLNALCFASFPLAKQALHRRQCAAMLQRVDASCGRWPSCRTPEQDALTLFDEGGVAIAVEHGVYAALSVASEAERSVQLLGAIEASHARVVPFGHALFEHLLEGLRCPGGSTRVVRVDSATASDDALLASVDRGLADQLGDAEAFRSPREGALPRIGPLLQRPETEPCSGP